MAAPKKEILKNNAFTSLASSMDDSQTTAVVSDGSVFPSTGNFRVVCENEIMLCTGRSGNTLTVVRGQEGTTAASHASSKIISHVLTADGLDRYGKDYVPLWGYSSIAARNRIVADDGVTPLTTSDFSWANQGSATVTDQAGTILMRAPAASGENVRVQYRAAPSPPYSYGAAFRALIPAHNATVGCFMFGFRKSSDGKLSCLTLQVHDNGGFYRAPWVVSDYNYNSPTSFNGTPRSVRFFNAICPEIHLKIEDDNTSLKWYMGDGIRFELFHSVGRTSFMSGGPDQIFWGINNYNNNFEALVRLMSWYRIS
jgi:hypothetical protein